MAELTHADFERTREMLSGDSDDEVRDLLINVYTEIEACLLGPDDDGDESFNWFYDRAVRRAHAFIVKQPCSCTFDDGRPEEICERCRAIGCALGDHTTPACRATEDAE